MSSRTAETTGMSRTSQSTNQRRHRSRSTTRYAELEKPKKKKTLSATTSLVSIPNTIKLSMLNSGLLSFDKFKLEARDENNSLSQTIPDTPIELRHFVKLCEQRRKFPVLYKLEFQTAIKVETNSCRHATRKNNLEKNQNQKCIPYDYNRVVLEKIDGAADSDYVNASYVDSLLKPNAYIVTQGPTEETVFNFWRMIWQENVSAIIMLTKVFDFTKVMCVQYWPPSKDKDENYGDIFLGVAKEEQLANFHIRTFHVYKKIDDKIIEERELLQFHYTEWHSHTCPFSNAILEFRRRVRSVVGNIIKANSRVGPMLVHCNDGGGRSGVYLSIDANMELAEEEDCFHVYGFFKRLRQSRKGLIENVDQYKFVYDTLEEHIICGNSWFPVSQLSDRLKQKSQKDIITKMNEYQKEYTQICKQTPRFSIGDCAGGHRGDNREKNRDVLCVPPDNFRPYLTSFQGNAFTDYINSVFVDGYTRPREYIVTEWPLKQTLGEFWSLVYDHECSAVVVLCQPPHNSQQYPAFWPESKTPKKYGPVFTVNHKSHHHYTNIKTWLFEINKKIISLTELMAGVKAPSKNIQLFQLTCWPMGHKVPTSTNSLVALMNMVEKWRQKSDYGPVCVVSPDGRSRAGVYCAANACIEQVIQHGEVDIFQAVKTVRRHRPQLVENITEYKYCYDLVLHYVLHYLNKDLKEKKFIEFGRGRSIPLTPENSNADLPNEISNAGRIVVKKRFAKIEKGENLNDELSTKKLFMDKNGKIVERKKKGRLYSLGGNDLPKKSIRGRLDRLKTVGTFDLGTEMCALSKIARNLNEQIITGEMQMNQQTIQETVSKESLSFSNQEKSGNIQGKSGLNTSLEDKHIITQFSNNFLSNLKKNNLKLYQQKSMSVPTVQLHNSVENLNINDSKNIKSEILVNSKKYNKINSIKSRSLSTGSCIINDFNTLSIFKFYSDENQINKSNKNKNNIDNDSHKIAEDILSCEDINKTNENIKKNVILKRKKQLCKTARIIRSDSECLLDDEQTLQLNSKGLNINNSIYPACSREFNMDDYQKTSTDESSRNISIDELDTVFSDTNDLGDLERDYRQYIKSNLQREYKSDGDTLDETGKSQKEFSTWKNQSIEIDINLSPEKKYIPDNYIEQDKISDSSSFNKQNLLTSTNNSPKLIDDTSFESNDNSISKSLKGISVKTISPSNTNKSISKNINDASISRIIDKRLSRFKKMNKLLKSKRFSTSTLYDKKKSNSPLDPSYLPNPKSNDSPEKSRISSSKNSIYSSKGSLITAGKSNKTGFWFLSRKSSLFSTSSHSNSELNSRTSSGNKLNEISKSNSDINKYKSSPSFRLRLKPEFNQQDSDSNLLPPPLNPINTCQSPLSEEFYNKTGSVRLSAIELFEKFCSEDFGGLYKNENKTEQFSPKFISGNQKKELGAIKKGTMTRQSWLLKQKSEPKFSMGNISTKDIQETMYYHREEDEDAIECENSKYSNENYEFSDTENDDDENESYETDNDGNNLGNEIENENYFERQQLSTGNLTNIIEIFDFKKHTLRNTKIYDNNQDANQESDIDEIILMPNHESIKKKKKRPSLVRASGFDYLNNSFIDKNNMNLNKSGSDEILTIYRICSKNELTITTSEYDISLSQHKQNIQNNQNKTQSTPSLLSDEKLSNKIFQETIEKLNDNLCKDSYLALDPNFIKIDCTHFEKTNSIDLLSNSSGTNKSESNFTDYGLDTVRNLNLDSCSTSKLSLSLKSEIFEDSSLTMNDIPITRLIQNCDIEDFTLTPEGSILDDELDDNIDNISSSDNHNNNIQNVIKTVDEFLVIERHENYYSQLSKKQSNIFNFENLSLHSTPEQSNYTIVDLDEESSGGGVNSEKSVSAFTNQITKEFDLLFYKAEEECKSQIIKENSTDDLLENKNLMKKSLMPSRHSMQKLEPISIESTTANNVIISNDKIVEKNCNYNNDGVDVNKIEIESSSSNIEKRNLCSKLSSNRSQSVGNLNKKTRCFPL